MGKLRLAVFTVFLGIGTYLIDQDDIVLSTYLNDNIGQLDAHQVSSNTFLTYGDLIDHLFDDCNEDRKTRLIIERNRGYQNLRIKTKGRIIIEPMNNCYLVGKYNSRNLLIISDDNNKDSRNITLLDSDKSIYNKLMFHYMNYGARPVYAERPSKASLIIRMSRKGDIKLFNQLMRKVAIQCEKLDKNFPNMIPCFAVMFHMAPPPPPSPSFPPPITEIPG